MGALRRMGVGWRACGAFLVGDQPRAAPAREKADRPPREDEQAVLEADQVEEVDGGPRQPGGKPAQAQTPDLGDGACAPNGGQVALVDVTEGRRRGAAEAVADQPG